jgi:putative sterol carrier protein
MTDTTTEFFERLARRSHEPLLGKVKATIRFELVQGKRKRYWRVAIDRGDVSVRRGNGAADSTVRGDEALFDRLVSGQANATAELLRGRLVVSGDLEPLILFQRLFPGPSLGGGAS